MLAKLVAEHSVMDQIKMATNKQERKKHLCAAKSIYTVLVVLIYSMIKLL